MLSNMLTSNMVKNGVIEAKKFGYTRIVGWLQDLNRGLNGLADFTSQDKEKEKKVSQTQFSEVVKEFIDYNQLIEELEFAADEVRGKQRKSYLGGIQNFLESWKGPDEGFVRYISERNSKFGPVTILTYACLDPSIITKEIFSHLYSGVVMSGTLKPTFMYKDVLAIDRAIEKEYSSPFPLENKLTIIIPETTTKYTLRNELMYRKIAEKCSELSSLIPGNVALFFPSYELRDNIGKLLSSSKKLFWEKSELSKEEKDLFLEQFKIEKDQGAALLGVAGANFAEGIDLPGDLLNGVIVVGLPLAKPNLFTRETINYLDKKFGKGWEYGYIYPAMNKCFQSAGRCIRSETDRGVIIYL
ncbi:hypothetical protein HZC32_01760, partial [Candidatus Woesearchaeota archaeon]|nr:hypothetical protein [Candidatus Woesearchaeota archaeon]